MLTKNREEPPPDPDDLLHGKCLTCGTVAAVHAYQAKSPDGAGAMVRVHGAIYDRTVVVRNWIGAATRASALWPRPPHSTR
jgi:hypothetical protein